MGLGSNGDPAVGVPVGQAKIGLGSGVLEVLHGDHGFLGGDLGPGHWRQARPAGTNVAKLSQVPG